MGGTNASGSIRNTMNGPLSLVSPITLKMGGPAVTEKPTNSKSGLFFYPWTTYNLLEAGRRLVM